MDSKAELSGSARTYLTVLAWVSRLIASVAGRLESACGGSDLHLFKACCFSGRPDLADLQLLRPARFLKAALEAQWLLEGEASVSVDTEVINVAAAGIANRQA